MKSCNPDIYRCFRCLNAAFCEEYDEAALLKTLDCENRRLDIPRAEDGTLLTVLLIVMSLALSGCGVIMKGVQHVFVPDPENIRQEEETKREVAAYETLRDPNVDDKKANMVSVIRKNSGKQSHPTFWSSIVSGLYTEEGRRLAMLTTAWLSSLGVMIWQILKARGLGLALTGEQQAHDTTIKAVSAIMDNNPSLAHEIKATLASWHSTVPVDMNLRVKKALGKQIYV